MIRIPQITKGIRKMFVMSFRSQLWQHPPDGRLQNGIKIQTSKLAGSQNLIPKSMNAIHSVNGF